jgi:serine/threonine protein kinase
MSAEDSSFLDQPQAPGELGRLGPFRVLEMIGSGATGIVFRAEDTTLRRVVALKVLRPAIAANVESRRRFLREARATAAFDHDNILTIHQVGEDHGVPWLAMKLLRGPSLKDRLGSGNDTLPTDQVLRIGAEVADALAVAHAGGLVHRDIKPSNILLEEGTERVKLIDFGLALVNDDEGQLTRTGCVVGTPAYMAPEQADGLSVDHRSDLYALGCVLYRCCTGRLPFEGQTFIQVFYAQRTKDAIPPRELVPTIAPELNDLIMKLIAKEAADRPQSALEVRDALRALRTELAAKNSLSETVSVVAAADTKETAGAGNPWAEVIEPGNAETSAVIRSSSSWYRRTTVPKWLWAVIAASVGLLIVALLLAMRR